MGSERRRSPECAATGEMCRLPSFGHLGSTGQNDLGGHSLVLLDDLVGVGEDRWRHGQAERLGGFEVDDQLECSWLLDR